MPSSTLSQPRHSWDRWGRQVRRPHTAPAPAPSAVRLCCVTSFDHALIAQHGLLDGLDQRIDLAAAGRAGTAAADRVGASHRDGIAAAFRAACTTAATARRRSISVGVVVSAEQKGM